MIPVPSQKPKFSKYLFWDINTGKLDYDKRASFVLERVFTMGLQKDETEAVNFYGKERIKKEIVKSKAIDRKTLNYLSVFYDIPKRKFVCYRKDVFQKGF